MWNLAGDDFISEIFNMSSTVQPLHSVCFLISVIVGRSVVSVRDRAAFRCASSSSCTFAGLRYADVEALISDCCSGLRRLAMAKSFTAVELHMWF